MKAAIREAKKAWALGEVPIGCVIVYEDKIIGRGYNRRMVDHSALAHAEIAKAGCAGSVLNLLDEKGFNHQVETEEGLLGEECSMMLKEFFKELREKRKKKKEEKAGE